jgi:hypothetical protein
VARGSEQPPALRKDKTYILKGTNIFSSSGSFGLVGIELKRKLRIAVDRSGSRSFGLCKSSMLSVKLVSDESRRN